LGLPLALLCLCLFGWNFLAFAHDTSGVAAWRYLDVSTSPFTTPLALHFVLMFAGEARRLRWILRVLYAAAAALSLASLSAFVSAWGRGFAGSETWAMLHIVLAIAGVGLAVWTMVHHLRQATTAAEKMRARLVLVALLVGGAVASTELWADAGLDVPKLGNVGTLVVASVLTLVALRLRLFDENPGFVAGLVALGIATSAVFGYLSIFNFLAANSAAAVLGTILVTIAFVIALRSPVGALATQRAHRQRLALLGRLSAQMAHDLKTPLTSIKGAAQFLQEERAQGRSVDDQGEFLTLLVEESDRLSRLVDKYRRLSKMEPERSPEQLNDLVRRAAALPGLSAPSEAVVLSTELAGDLPPCPVDADLVLIALENLVRNAYAAMPEGGEVTLRTERTEDGALIAVTDTGSGMNARLRERAFDEFFTTKATGSGLGLAFVRRLVEAHGGRVALESEPDHGTEVRLYFPVD
jgi:signal transduction histidine kinase